AAAEPASMARPTPVAPPPLAATSHGSGRVVARSSCSSRLMLALDGFGRAILSEGHHDARSLRSELRLDLVDERQARILLAVADLDVEMGDALACRVRRDRVRLVGRALRDELAVPLRGREDHDLEV